MSSWKRKCLSPLCGRRTVCPAAVPLLLPPRCAPSSCASTPCPWLSPPASSPPPGTSTAASRPRRSPPCPSPHVRRGWAQELSRAPPFRGWWLHQPLVIGFSKDGEREKNNWKIILLKNKRTRQLKQMQLPSNAAFFEITKIKTLRSWKLNAFDESKLLTAFLCQNFDKRNSESWHVFYARFWN